MEDVNDEDDTSGAKEEGDQDQSEGRVWHVQAHARNSITSMKVDPVNGSGVSRVFSAYHLNPPLTGVALLLLL
jgi:hypothetical protein